jgi:hypothetical protein
MRWILLSRNTAHLRAAPSELLCVSQRGVLVLAFSLLPTLWRLFLVGVLALALLFWIAVGIWIVVRLARTAHTHKEHKADGEE